VAGRQAQAHLLGQLGHREAAIVFERSKNFSIQRIHGAVSSNFKPISGEY
jgi:flagellar motor switch protein FliG